MFGCVVTKSISRLFFFNDLLFFREFFLIIFITLKLDSDIEKVGNGLKLNADESWSWDIMDGWGGKMMGQYAYDGLGCRIMKDMVCCFNDFKIRNYFPCKHNFGHFKVVVMLKFDPCNYDGWIFVLHQWL